MRSQPRRIDFGLVGDPGFPPDMETSIGRIMIVDEVVIPAQTVTIEFTYPLAGPVRFDFEADTDDGFTRGHLLRCIQRGYHFIYGEEEDVTGDPGTVADRTGNPASLLNRAATAGPYGVWGHALQDLVIDAAFYHSDERLVTLSILS